MPAHPRTLRAFLHAMLSLMLLPAFMSSAQSSSDDAARAQVVLRGGAWLLPKVTLRYGTSPGDAWGGELVFHHPLMCSLRLEAAVGAWTDHSSLPAFERRDEANNYLGTYTSTSRDIVWPLTLGLAWSPVSVGMVRPAVSAGLGAYTAHTVSTLERIDASVPDVSETQTLVRMGGWAALDVDVRLSVDFDLNLRAARHSVKFQSLLSTYRQDFTGVQLMLGAAYAM